MVDIFTKFTQVVTLKGKTEPEVLEGIQECLKLMKRKPKSMYMDSEGAFVGKVTKAYFERENIEYFLHEAMLRLLRDKSAQSKNCYTGV